MQGFFNHIELWLTAAGVTAIIASPALVDPAAHAPHTVMAGTATILGVLNGLMAWAFRRRQRQVRSAAIEDIQRTLVDRIDCPVTFVMLSLSDPPTVDAEQLQRLALVRRSIRDTSARVGSLREEPVQDWHAA